MRLVPMAGLLLAAMAGITAGGCPGGITITLPESLDFTADVTIPTQIVTARVVQVEVFNDTDFEVLPRIRFDDDSNFWAALVPSEELATGILQPGESIVFDIDCDQLGLIFSDEPRQYAPGREDPIGEADETRTLKRDKDYVCGDQIVFHFIGNGAGFGVIVSINGVVVD